MEGTALLPQLIVEQSTAEFQGTSAACASYPSVTNCFGQPRQSVMNWNESRWLWYAGFYGGLLSALSGCHGRWAGALAQR
jgi:hypothetical protein